MNEQERLEQHASILIDAIAPAAGISMASIDNPHPEALCEALLAMLSANFRMMRGMSRDEAALLTREIRELIAGRILDAARNRN